MCPKYFETMTIIIKMTHNHDNFNPMVHDPPKRTFFRPTKDVCHQFTGHNVFKICIVCGIFSNGI